MADALQVTALGKRWVAAAPATIFAGLLDTIIKDGPRVTLLAAGSVLVLMLPAFGPRGAAPVSMAITVGVVWLGGRCGLFGLKLNFMNYSRLRRIDSRHAVTRRLLRHLLLLERAVDQVSLIDDALLLSKSASTFPELPNDPLTNSLI
jgi:hypothetical protein